MCNIFQKRALWETPVFFKFYQTNAPSKEILTKNQPKAQVKKDNTICYHTYIKQKLLKGEGVALLLYNNTPPTSFPSL